MSVAVPEQGQATRNSVQFRRKAGMAAAFKADCEGSEAVFVAEYKGIAVAELGVLRHRARAAGGRVRVVKNTVARRVLGSEPRFASLADSLAGQLIYGVGPSGPAIAKVLRDFSSEHEQLKLVAGAMEGRLLDAGEVERLASLPSRDAMLGILAGALAAPISKLASTLNQLPASLARAVAAVRDARQAGNGA